MGFSLRAFCQKAGEDPSNWSKMERGIIGAPTEYSRLLEIAKHLDIADDERKQELFDLASAERGRIPKDIMTEQELVSNLPVVFRTLRGEVPTEEELLKLADKIRKARTE